MTLQDYWDILRRSWLLILGTTVAGAAAALGLSLLQTPIYQAQSQLFVSVQSSDDVSGAYTGGLYVQQRIKSYVTVVDSPAVLEPVIDELDLDTAYSPLTSQVSAVNPTNTVLLNVLATDTDPAQAAAIADATAKSLAAEIVRLETTDSGSKPVKAEIIRPAEVPSAPVSPRTQLNIVLGALLGLMLGAGIAILRRVTDTSIGSSADLEEASQATQLAVVTFDPDAKTHPLVTLRGSPRAEAFRTLRTNLRYVDVDNPPRSVVVTSSLPAEGKTTTACNLAIALAQAGSKVLLARGRPAPPPCGRLPRRRWQRGPHRHPDRPVHHQGLDRQLAAWPAGLPALRRDPAEPQRAARLPADDRPARGVRPQLRRDHPRRPAAAAGQRRRHPRHHHRRRAPRRPLRRPHDASRCRRPPTPCARWAPASWARS